MTRRFSWFKSTNFGLQRANRLARRAKDNTMPRVSAKSAFFVFWHLCRRDDVSRSSKFTVGVIRLVYWLDLACCPITTIYIHSRHIRSVAQVSAPALLFVKRVFLNARRNVAAVFFPGWKKKLRSTTCWCLCSPLRTRSLPWCLHITAGMYWRTEAVTVQWRTLLNVYLIEPSAQRILHSVPSQPHGRL